MEIKIIRLICYWDILIVFTFISKPKRRIYLKLKIKCTLIGLISLLILSMTGEIAQCANRGVSDSMILKTIYKLSPDINKSVANKISKSIIKYSKKYGIPPALVLSVMYHETGFKLKQQNRGCYGLMQINYWAHKKEFKIKSSKSLYDIDTNINIGCQLLQQYTNNSKQIKIGLYKYVGGSKHRYVYNVVKLYKKIQEGKIV